MGAKISLHTAIYPNTIAKIEGGCTRLLRNIAAPWPLEMLSKDPTKLRRGESFLLIHR